MPYNNQRSDCQSYALLTMSSILLCTLNAKYIHASLGLRYLYANMAELKPQTQIKEFTIQTRAVDIVEELLAQKPNVVGFGVYIWNIEETYAVVAQLKQVDPSIKVVVGGPEISYESESHPIYTLVDHIVTGAADLSFYNLCQRILKQEPLIAKVIQSSALKLSDIALPYQYYTDDDLAHRLIYVEASRGCPFKCEFCLSALDKTSYPYDLDLFLNEMQNLFDRGARHFKFVDRTFNLKIATTNKILDFFLDKINEGIFLHFEVIPDHLPDKLKEKLVLFPEGSLQFEVGIQTFTEEVQSLISRKQNNQKSKENLIWLKQNTQAHIHADLIFGLPGETIETFEQSFNQLYQCSPHEIQLGILKRLKGSPIIRHTESFDLRFNPLPPYNILSTNLVSFNKMQQMNRFARYWDMLANSGRFKRSLPLIIESNPFELFMQLTEWLYATTQQTHQINLKRLFQILLNAPQQFSDLEQNRFVEALLQDYQDSKLKGPLLLTKLNAKSNDKTVHKRSIRQNRHID